MFRRLHIHIVKVLALLAGVCLMAAPAVGADASTIAGTGSVGGTVTASKPFTAAQVYLRNAERGVTFMVYTAGGKYQAVNLYPGDYQVTVERRGFASEPQTIKVTPGASAQADFVLKDADPTPRAGVNGPSTVVAYP